MCVCEAREREREREERGWKNVDEEKDVFEALARTRDQNTSQTGLF